MANNKNYSMRLEKRKGIYDTVRQKVIKGSFQSYSAKLESINCSKAFKASVASSPSAVIVISVP